MKKIIQLIFIILILTSCGENKEVNNEIDNIETKVKIEDKKRVTGGYENGESSKRIVIENESTSGDNSREKYVKENSDLKKKNITNNEIIEKQDETGQVIKEESIKIIKDYYSNIQNGDLEEAYKMKNEPNISLEEFKKQYNFDGGVQITENKFTNIGKNKYDFVVDIFYEKTGLVERYNTSMEIIEGNKLKTLSVKKIEKEITEKIEFLDMKAYVEWNKGEKYLYIEKNGKKEIIKSYKSKLLKDGEYSWHYTFTTNIFGLKFIDNGNILVSEDSGWEFHGHSFYNLKNGKLIELGDLSNYGITKDNKYFYVCGEAGMAGGGIKIYSYSNFTLHKDLAKEGEGYVSNCYGFEGYNKDKNILKYELGGENEYEYNFDTGEIIKK